MVITSLFTVIIILLIACIWSTLATQNDAKRYLKKHWSLDDFWWIKDENK